MLSQELFLDIVQERHEKFTCHLGAASAALPVMKLSDEYFVFIRTACEQPWDFKEKPVREFRNLLPCVIHGKLCLQEAR